MSEYLGFVPEERDKYFFVGYNSGDAQRVGEIVQRMHNRDIPLWYDYGINYGDEWEKIISGAIRNSQAVIIFVTKDLLYKEDTYVRTERKIAGKFKKRIYYVTMDDEINVEKVTDDNMAWWVNIEAIQNIEVFKLYDPDAITQKIAEAIGMGAYVAKENNTSVETMRLLDELKEIVIEESPKESATESTATYAAEQLVDTSTGRMVLDNRYELIEVIGKGGFGVTYSAKDLTVPGRIVAVKFGGFTARYIVRMHQYLVGKTNNNLCEIYGANITPKGESYIAMQLLNGRTSLASVKDYSEFYEKLGDNYPVGAHISVLIDILRGVKCLHDMGIVHDDISPCNILTDGFVTKLIDYDGAFFLKDKENPDGVNTTMFLEYRSPEKIGQRDFRSDLYSVGMVAYKWLTGNAPQRNEQGNLDLSNDLLDFEIKGILRKATALDPDHRYQTAEEFVSDLRMYHKRYVDDYKDPYFEVLKEATFAIADEDKAFLQTVDTDVLEAAEEWIALTNSELSFGYKECKKMENNGEAHSGRLIVPSLYQAITSRAFEDVRTSTYIFFHKEIDAIGMRCLSNLSSRIKAIFIHRSNPYYTIADNGKTLLDVRSGEKLPVKEGVILRYYG